MDTIAQQRLEQRIHMAHPILSEIFASLSERFVSFILQPDSVQQVSIAVPCASKTTQRKWNSDSSGFSVSAGSVSGRFRAGPF